MSEFDKRQPRISIILPVFNASRFLREALDSVLDQSYSNFEIIAVDDGSTDGSYYLLKQYAKQDPRIKVYRNESNLGVSITANKAIGYSTGRYIARMDADDVMLKDRLKRQLDFLVNNPEYVVVGGQVRLIDEDGNQLRIKNFPKTFQEIENMIYLACPIQQATMMVDSAKLPSDFIWYVNGMNTAEEVELLFKLKKFGKLGNIDSLVHNYRQHPGSLSHADPKKTFALTYTARRKGVEIHGFEPKLIQVLLVEVQKVLIYLLPNSLIYPVFYRLRAVLDFLIKVRLPQFNKNSDVLNQNIYKLSRLDKS